MMSRIVILGSLFLCIIYTSTAIHTQPKPKLERYEPTWDSLDKRPLPHWYDDVKLGIFVHFGVFSVPSFRTEWFWQYWQGDKNPYVVDYVKRNFKPDITYQDFAKDFTLDLFDPNEWADLFAQSGAGYVVLTSKHHEGYCNWDTDYSYSWNSLDVGPKRNIVKELAEAVRNRTKVHFGLYHSMYEWFHPLFLRDQANNFTTNDFVRTKTMPELHELVNKYQPDLIWSDGDWMAPPGYWNSTHFLAWLYNDSPVKDKIVVNDRWGIGTFCTHGGYWNCQDRYQPTKLMNHKWENCRTIDNVSWGYRRDSKLSDMLTIEDILVQLASTVSFGGNLLLNVGPRKDGRIDMLMQERLVQLGSWMKVNGESIYLTKPWKFQVDNATKNVWFTADRNNSVYGIFFDWPTDISNTLYLKTPLVDENTKIYLVGYNPATPLKFKASTPTGVTIELPPLNTVTTKWAWALKFTGLKNYDVIGPEEAEDEDNNLKYDPYHHITELIKRDKDLK